MGNLEKLDAMKELLYDWSVIGKQENGVWFPTYSTCDIWCLQIGQHQPLSNQTQLQFRL